MSPGRKGALWVFTFPDSRKRENSERERDKERETIDSPSLLGFGTKNERYSSG